MRLNQVRVFLTVVESGSIHAAARILEVSPPAITKSVRQLEEELHVRLLDRTRHGVVATPAGRTFLARARVAHSELRKAEEELSHYTGGYTGSVAFGVGPTHMMLIVPEAVPQFRLQYPGVRLRIVEGPHPPLVRMVRDETLDFALGLKPELKLDSGLMFRPLFRDDFLVAARKGHPLHGVRSLARLADAQWLTLTPRASPGGLVDQAFSAAGLSAPRSVIECESFTGIVALLARSDMITLTTRRLLASPFARDDLQEIPIADRLPSITHGIFTRSGAPLTRPAAALAKAVTLAARLLARRG
jgi:LysR family transcriptional regulator, regulator of abg operon